jgi:hypothetical protein
MGVPVTSYNLGIGQEHVEFAEAKIQARIITRDLSDAEIDALAVVAVAGEMGQVACGLCHVLSRRLLLMQVRVLWCCMASLCCSSKWAAPSCRSHIICMRCTVIPVAAAVVAAAAEGLKYEEVMRQAACCM